MINDLTKRNAIVQEHIVVRGAREHNLKNIDVDIPRNQLVVITGLSGSGKSSLAFDTVFAEGQRRYVESLSAYARQFLGQMEKPDVDQIEGLSPAVSIDQKGVSKNPRSTVGTVTEIYDYLRLLYARIGVPHCPTCGVVVAAQSAQQMIDEALQLSKGTRLQILAPVVHDKKGHHEKIIAALRDGGYVRARIDGESRSLDEEIELDRYVVHNIEAIVDRLVARSHADEEFSEYETRLTDAIETALELGDGTLVIQANTSDGQSQDILFSEHLACPHGHGSFPDLEPRIFSFNTPRGACERCQGLGFQLELDPDIIIPDRSRSLHEGAIRANGWSVEDRRGWTYNILRALAEYGQFSLDTPFEELTEEQRQIILWGIRDNTRIEITYHDSQGVERGYGARYEGVMNNLLRRYEQTESDAIRMIIEAYMTKVICPACEGKRLRAEALAVKVADISIYDVTQLPVKNLREWVNRLRGDVESVSELAARELQIGSQILKEIDARVRFLNDVGLGYLSLSRSASSLSGGEAQRIRLATQIGSRLTGVLYVLDEPSIGLHQRDNARLIQTLKDLRDLGNTVLVVEHDEEMMRSADWLIDMGPGAGEHGGEIIACGTPSALMEEIGSPTGDYLSGRFQIAMPDVRRNGNGATLGLRGARANNLKHIDVDIPLGKLICISGVSGSGKSTLLLDVLYRGLVQRLHGSRERPGAHDDIEGVEQIDKVIHIDQSPIGRTPRSNPSTYTKMFDEIRRLFAELPESKIRGYKAGRYSFNVKGGRCEHCQGQGQIKIEMQFMPDIFVQCDICNGTRYNRETLQVRFKDLNIADVLQLTVSEALECFTNIPRIVNKLMTLEAVGLGYIRLGQPANTLSGGEAQRVKLSRELSKRATGQTLYILDEPSTGLHAADVSKLIDVLQQLVNQGNTVIIIEHNLDILKVADHIIDMGPEGGDAGGEILVVGTPEQIAAHEGSYTARYLGALIGANGAIR